jgi:hypothetical protein
MDKETFEKLLENAPKEQRAKGVLLFNGAADTAIEYRNNPNAATLNNWQKAETALDEFVSLLSPVTEAKIFRTSADVLAYLKANGWRATKTTLYRHCKEGKLLPKNGQYELAAVDRYAKTWLKQQSSGKKISEQMDDLQRGKLRLEMKNLEIDNKRKLLAYEKDLEHYIRKDLVQIELAGRAGVLEAGLKHMIQSRAAEWIRLVNGEMSRIGDLIHLLNQDVEEHLNSYAAPIEYRTILDAEEAAENEEKEG